MAPRIPPLTTLLLFAGEDGVADGVPVVSTEVGATVAVSNVVDGASVELGAVVAVSVVSGSFVVLVAFFVDEGAEVEVEGAAEVELETSEM